MPRSLVSSICSIALVTIGDGVMPERTTSIALSARSINMTESLLTRMAGASTTTRS